MKPRLLLVEDDPLSQAFLHAVLESLPATVDVANSATEAMAQPAIHDLWLIDVNLPDGRGTELLAHLRHRCGRTPALAHTADDTPALHQHLLESGFVGVLLKPITATALLAQVRTALSHGFVANPSAPPSSADSPVWNDAQALAALNGNADSVRQLRELFRIELGGQKDRIASAIAARDYAAAHAELHRLKASSGFVGAARVQQATAALARQPEDPALLHALLDACEQSLP